MIRASSASATAFTSERPPRYEYLLTAAGAELQPILLALKESGDRHINTGAEPIIFEYSCGAQFHPLTVCAACRDPYRAGDLTVMVEPTPWKRRCSPAS